MPGAETKHKVRDVNVRMLRGGSGPPLLFLHGANGLPVWLPVFDLLSKQFEVFVPEHPGFGLSDNPPWMRNIGDLAMYYLDFLDGLGPYQVNLVGHSLGGWTAAEIAVRNTARLKSLTLLAPAGVRSPNVPFGDIFLWSPEQHAQHMFYDKKFVDERLKQLATMDQDIWLQNRAAGARLAWNPRLNNPQLPYWLHRIDVPTHIVWGEGDFLIPPAHGEELQRLIPGATLTRIAGIGHLGDIEAPSAFAEAIVPFIAGLKP